MHTHTHTHTHMHPHCKGVVGYFEVSDDVSDEVFSEIGKSTPIGVHFSTVGQLTLRCIYKCRIILEYSVNIY